ncbi:MotA/TolQ/ExbB proton channel family protein [Alphaproteobacteria bacterium]|nr:MotA/TolQ/ExbB proton channel family protein [Alphaproteobacteria bacterium]MDA8725183.1 MotA/TolQ/ExbB proton channel family protein [Alphaproteobacteria bacterium]
MSDTSARANSKALQQGLIVLGLILFGGYLLFDLGLVGVLLEGDKSRLSWLILAIWLGMSARWLFLLRRIESTDAIAEDDMVRWLNHGWFAADSVLKIGLLGTIIGFILMLAPIGELTSFDASSLQSALAAMSAGMAVALYTTLTGLIANIILRFQFQFLADAMQKRLTGKTGNA